VPEGDTTWRTARTLHAALCGKAVVAFDSVLPAVAAAGKRLSLVGRSVEGVEARGKHLLVRFTGGAVLHTHQGMRGSWHLYRRGGPWRRPASRARAAIETADAVALCFLSPVVEVLSPSEVASHPALARLGPDLLQPDFDTTLARRRLRERAHVEIGVALMDQSALAGIGNVYKSEALFLAGVSPFERVAGLDDATLDRLVAVARDLMRRNLSVATRRTTTALAPGRLWVYRRASQPCRRCGSSIARATQGEQARSTYYCPTCQGAARRPSPPGLT
jgi:endonuclease-8